MRLGDDLESGADNPGYLVLAVLLGTRSRHVIPQRRLASARILLGKLVLQANLEDAQVRVPGYRQMTNHVHFVLCQGARTR